MTTPPLPGINEESHAVSANAAQQAEVNPGQKQAVSSCSGLASAGVTGKQTRALSHIAAARLAGEDAMSAAQRAEAFPEAANAADRAAAASRARPVTAGPQARSPGGFLRLARPQAAAAAKVAGHARLQSPNLGLHNFNEPKQESGWVDFRAQPRMGKRVRTNELQKCSCIYLLKLLSPLRPVGNAADVLGFFSV